jgi:hypothetical protein
MKKEKKAALFRELWDFIANDQKEPLQNALKSVGKGEEFNFQDIHERVEFLNNPPGAFAQHGVTLLFSAVGKGNEECSRILQDAGSEVTERIRSLDENKILSDKRLLSEVSVDPINLGNELPSKKR